ncbi:MAG: YdeI/OmpD-associated family protein [Chloroflexota bacterium]
MRFRTTILTTGKTAAGIRVPDDVLAALGTSRKPAVRVTINGFTYRSTVATVNGAPMVGVSAENRAAAGVAGGEAVDVDIELDTEPREVTIPSDFDAALDRDPAARRFFEGLSYSDKRFHTLQIEGAKTDETRQRRIEKSVGLLRAGRKR